MKQTWRTIYFADCKGNSPVKAFFEQPSDKGITAGETKMFAKRLSWVQERGLELIKERGDVLESLQDEDNLYSLRVPSKTNNPRILLCAIPDKKILVLLVAFKEKSRKDYRKAIKEARKRRDDVISTFNQT